MSTPPGEFLRCHLKKKKARVTELLAFVTARVLRTWHSRKLWLLTTPAAKSRWKVSILEDTVWFEMFIPSVCLFGHFLWIKVMWYFPFLGVIPEAYHMEHLWNGRKVKKVVYSLLYYFIHCLFFKMFHILFIYFIEKPYIIKMSEITPQKKKFP